MRHLVIAILLGLASPCFAFEAKDYPPPPPNGYVPDASTAIAIARAVLVPIHGESLPKDVVLKAERKDDLWYVYRPLNCPPPSVCVGGAEQIILSAKDGRILAVFRHG